MVELFHGKRLEAFDRYELSCKILKIPNSSQKSVGLISGLDLLRR